MRASDHPAARRTTESLRPAEPPPAPRQPPVIEHEPARVAHEPPVIVDESRKPLAEIAREHDSMPNESSEGTADPDFNDESGNVTDAASLPVETEASVFNPLPTREPIETAPRDGFDVLVFYSPADETGRLARWHNGRRFNGRRWVSGGHWVPADSMIPLPAVEPSEWLRPPRPAAEDEPEAA
jgi:hypothetical protein